VAAWSAPRPADRLDLAGLGEWLRPGEQVRPPGVHRLKQRPYGHRGDVPLVDGRGDGLRVRAPHHPRPPDLWRPGQRVRGEIGAAQNRPLQTGLLRHLLRRVELRDEAGVAGRVGHRGRREHDYPLGTALGRPGQQLRGGGPRAVEDRLDVRDRLQRRVAGRVAGQPCPAVAQQPHRLATDVPGGSRDQHHDKLLDLLDSRTI
jgi:hypothetical protein